MSNYGDLLNVMKQAGANATKADNPVNVCFGKVTSTTPLNVLVEQKITLGTAQLILTRNVTDYDVNVTMDDAEEKQKMTIHNALLVGDKVILLRVQGGQKYVVMDRVV